MSDIYQQIEFIEKELRETPHHKATDHYIGRLRAKLSNLKDKVIENQQGSKGGSKKGYAVKHQGDATLILIGPPSAGKSTLLNLLTNAKSKVAPYSFTTVTVIPGMMELNGAKIQILDVPGLIEGAEEGKGRGREVLSVTRGCDLIVIMSDVKRISAIKRIENALYANGIRLNEDKPKVEIIKKHAGGIIIHSNIKNDFDKITIKEIAQECGLKNAEITISEQLTIDQLIDSMSRNRVYIPSIRLINKIDQKNTVDFNVDENEHILISAENNINIEYLKENIWSKLKFLKVYLVRKDDKPNLNNPIIMKEDQNILDVLDNFGEEFKENKKQAMIWGNGAKFEGQKVPLLTKLQEGMIIRFI